MAAPTHYRYVISSPSGPFAFIPHPAVRGAWLRLHPCVLVVDCPYLNCNAKIGQPCRSKNRVANTWTHHVRRQAGKEAVAKLPRSAVFITTVPKQKG